MAIEPHNGMSKMLQELLDKLSSQEAVGDHEELSGLLGGGPNEHYHLTGSERNKLLEYPEYRNLNHERLQGLLGGDARGHYHLTQDEHDKLSGLPTAITQNHEGLSGLLGGNAAGHYHLTPSELGKLQSYPEYGSLNHEQLQGLLGGNAGGHYHLTYELLNKLMTMPEGGATGEAGQAATIQIGKVTTGAAGSSASVTNVGTSSAAIFDFVIPRGATGAQGPQGPQGPAGSGSSVDIINNLTSTRTDAALSANQGKILNDKIKNYYTEDWTFTLEDGSTVTKTVVLS